MSLDQRLDDLEFRSRMGWWRRRDLLLRELAAEGVDREVLAQRCGTTVPVILEVVGSVSTPEA